MNIDTKASSQTFRNQTEKERLVRVDNYIDELHEQLEKLTHEQLLKSLKISTEVYASIMLEHHSNGLTLADFYVDTLFQILHDDHGYESGDLDDELFEEEEITIH